MNKLLLVLIVWVAYWPVAVDVAFAVSGTNEAVDEEKWGEPVNGLQMRIVSIVTESDEHDVEFETAERCTEFTLASEVTFLVQLKNASDEKIELKGVRYDQNVSGSWPGKSAQTQFGPRLFQVEIRDFEGNLIAVPLSDSVGFRAYDSEVESLEPGEIVTMFLTPIRWDESLSCALQKGTYEIALTYLGHEGFWNDRIVAKQNVKIAKSFRDVRHTLVWGLPKDGIRVAAEYRLADQRAEKTEETSERTFPLGSKLNVFFHFQNTSREPIEFTSGVWRQDDQLFLVKDNDEKSMSSAWYSGITPQKTWTIQPKQILVIPALAIGVFEQDPGREIDHPIGPKIITSAGEIRLRHQMTSGQSTGTTLMTIRERLDSDDPPSLAAKLRFLKPDGEYADKGFVQIQLATNRRTFFEGEFDGSTLPLEDWKGEKLRVYARIASCEEEVFEDVDPHIDPVIRLSKSQPTTGRILNSDGQPIAGAKIRYFNRTTMSAKNYPYPMKGLEGPVFATSDEAGKFRIDSMKQFASRKGNEEEYIYTFFIEPPDDYASKVVGPIVAGDLLDDLVLSPLLEVSGIVKGTKEQLQNFAAEWDQPIGLELGDGEISSLWGISKELQLSQDGDQLKFRIRDLRPGKLRIIANFDPRPHSIHKNYALRDPRGSDLLFEFDLTQSRDDLVLQPKVD